MSPFPLYSILKNARKRQKVNGQVPPYASHIFQHWIRGRREPKISSQPFVQDCSSFSSDLSFDISSFTMSLYDVAMISMTMDLNFVGEFAIHNFNIKTYNLQFRWNLQLLTLCSLFSPSSFTHSFNSLVLLLIFWRLMLIGFLSHSTSSVFLTL